MDNLQKEFIFGIRAVVEAIESGKSIDKVLVKSGCLYKQFPIILSKRGSAVEFYDIFTM